MYEKITLPYQFDELANYISKKTLENHYNVLYEGYVKNFNKVLKDLETARQTKNYDNIKALEKDLAFQGGGAILHTMYFENLTPHKTNMSLDLKRKVEESFGGINEFKEQFIKSTSKIEGSGWGILGYNKSLNKLIILQVEKHSNLSIWDFVPLLVIDIWEHAYYLDYQTKKDNYLNRIIDIINWDIVSKRFSER
ncbi:MAG: superoxide dismutase [Bacilli bacterium]|nr:superoxide dismutase [Bacilli bacterium]MDD4795611.1 superoxide dismutase [Bacilli bacterium]